MNFLLISLVIASTLFSRDSLCASKKFIIKADGSSTVFPLTEAVAEEFQKDTRGSIQATVGLSGTGGGFKKFCRGETHIQNASRPITSEEIQSCNKTGVNFYELPIAYDAITVVVHPENNWLHEISTTDLKKIWEPGAEGKITKWSDLKKDFPQQKIELFGAGSDSGTFDYFTEIIVGKAKSSRTDFTASEDDNTLVQGIANNKFALGYIPFSYYLAQQKKLKALSIKHGITSAKAVAPTAQTVENGEYVPLARPIFIYISQSAANGHKEVQQFVDFYLRHVARLTTEIGFVPLNSATYALIQTNYSKQRTGSYFTSASKDTSNLHQIIENSKF